MNGHTRFQGGDKKELLKNCWFFFCKNYLFKNIWLKKLKLLWRHPQVAHIYYCSNHDTTGKMGPLLGVWVWGELHGIIQFCNMLKEKVGVGQVTHPPPLPTPCHFYLYACCSKTDN